MERLLNFLLGHNSDFYPFERQILEIVAARMECQDGVRLKRQIDAVNHIQRLRNGREVNLYQICNGKVAFDDNLRLSNTADELNMASVTLRLAGNRKNLRVVVWMVKGRLFSLEFSESPKKFFAGSSLLATDSEIIDVEIHCDQLQQ